MGAMEGWGVPSAQVDIYFEKSTVGNFSFQFRLILYIEIIIILNSYSVPMNIYDGFSLASLHRASFFPSIVCSEYLIQPYTISFVLKIKIRFFGCK